MKVSYHKQFFLLLINSDVVKAERKLGLRKSGRRGFDVIAQVFFVEEEWFSKNLVGLLFFKKTINFNNTIFKKEATFITKTKYIVSQQG